MQIIWKSTEWFNLLYKSKSIVLHELIIFWVTLSTPSSIIGYLQYCPSVFNMFDPLWQPSYLSGFFALKCIQLQNLNPENGFWQKWTISRCHILDLTFSISSLRRILPDADLGTALMNVTLRNLLKCATCKQIQKWSEPMPALKHYRDDWWSMQTRFKSSNAISNRWDEFLCDVNKPPVVW